MLTLRCVLPLESEGYRSHAIFFDDDDAPTHFRINFYIVDYSSIKSSNSLIMPVEFADRPEVTVVTMVS